MLSSHSSPLPITDGSILHPLFALAVRVLCHVYFQYQSWVSLTQTMEVHGSLSIFGDPLVLASLHLKQWQRQWEFSPAVPMIIEEKLILTANYFQSKPLLVLPLYITHLPLHVSTCLLFFQWEKYLHVLFKLWELTNLSGSSASIAHRQEIKP